MFNENESLALARLKVKYASEKHETATFHVKHLEFLRWLYQHGKMEMDLPTSESISWREEYERSRL